MNNLQKMPPDKSILADRTFEFAINIIKIYKHLARIEKEYVMSNQLLRSGTAIGAMVREARNGESKLDFIHKLSIAFKECNESIY